MTQELAIRTPRDLLNYFDKNGSAIENVLPRHLQASRMKRLAVSCFKANTSTGAALRKCSPQSILDSLITASLLGLEPGVAGQGYLIPYNGTCTFVPGWQGLVGLLNNTGRATAWTGAVFEGDEFVYQKGSHPKCIHVPGPNDGDPSKITWFYGVGKVNGSEQPVIEAWTAERVWRHRDRFNKVGKRHYSYEHPEQYGRKVVLLQVLKYMPRSIELNNALTAADAAEMGQTTRVEDSVVIIDAEPGDIPQQKPTFEAVKPKADPQEVGRDTVRETLRHDDPNNPPMEPGIADAIAEQIIEKATMPLQPITPEESAAIQDAAVARQVAAQPKPWDKGQKSVRAKAGPVQEPPGPKEMLIAAGVPFDDFTDWMVNTARNTGAKDWGSYDDVPSSVWKLLEKDTIGISKCCVLYGTQPAL
jgi:recombination protein RecT